MLHSDTDATFPLVMLPADVDVCTTLSGAADFVAICLRSAHKQHAQAFINIRHGYCGWNMYTTGRNVSYGTQQPQE